MSKKKKVPQHRNRYSKEQRNYDTHLFLATMEMLLKNNIQNKQNPSSTLQDGSQYPASQEEQRLFLQTIEQLGFSPQTLTPRPSLEEEKEYFLKAMQGFQPQKGATKQNKHSKLSRPNKDLSYTSLLNREHKKQSLPMFSEQEKKLFLEAMHNMRPLDILEEALAKEVSKPHKKATDNFSKNIQKANNKLSTNKLSFSLEYQEEHRFFVKAIRNDTPHHIRQQIEALHTSSQVINHTIDLHNMTLVTAYATALKFIQQTYTSNIHTCCIITGKGKHSLYQKGIIRQFLVDWLLEYPMREVIYGFITPAKCNGAEGAIAVYLQPYSPTTKIQWNVVNKQYISL